MATTSRDAEQRALRRREGYLPLRGYAAIGDGRTIALVGCDGAIDWLPLPTIDQDAAFARLLDAQEGGAFTLSPGGSARTTRRYLPGTNVLETTFTTDDGVAVVTDALTLQDGSIVPWIELARHIRCTAGRIRFEWAVAPRFGFTRERVKFGELRDVPVALGDRLRLAVLHWGGEQTVEDDAVRGTLELAEGDSALLACIATDNAPVPLPPRAEIENRLGRTRRTWRRWVGRNEYDGRWPDAVARSALALKLLIYGPSGAITAAGTTGLPERVGGPRNYDYRYCWIRDTAFALDALGRLGYREQVQASLSWLLDASSATHPRLEPFYALDGAVPRQIDDLPLAGYRNSRPVRTGNSAATQLQLGNFGDLFTTVLHYVDGGNALDPLTGTRLAESADFVCRVWRNDDSGLWELGTLRPYTSSKMACWASLHVAADLARRGHVPDGNVAHWSATADEIREYVETQCWSETAGAYTFFAGSDELDCAVLRSANLGFADPTGERMNGTIDAVLRRLSPRRPLLYRYSGSEREEGCFLACSFWLVTALARAKRLDEARAWMDDLVELGNDVGLYSEEIDPSTLELLGNFPQALTHLALIGAAYAIADENQRTEGAT